MEWAGSVAVITGASRGIGAATARAAAAKGATLGLIARSADGLEQVLAACGGRGIAIAADVADRAAVTEAIDAIQGAHGRVDILVNNAGVGAYGPFADADLDAIERMLRVNYLGTVYATRAVLPGMLERGRGHLVMVNSIAGRVGAPLEAGYSASKFAMTGFGDAVSIEVARAGVGVSTIHPGPVETEFFATRGVPYRRKRPRPVSAELIARRIVSLVERDGGEAFVPRWLRVPWIARTILPPAYRTGIRRAFRDEL